MYLVRLLILWQNKSYIAGFAYIHITRINYKHGPNCKMSIRVIFTCKLINHSGIFPPGTICLYIISQSCFVNCIPACFAFWLNANTSGSSSSLLFPLDSVLNSFNSSCFLKSVSDITIFLPLSICLHI